MYLDGDVGGSFLVGLAFRKSSIASGVRIGLPRAIASSLLVFRTVGLPDLSMASSFAGLVPSGYTALLPRWRLREFCAG